MKKHLKLKPEETSTSTPKHSGVESCSTTDSSRCQSPVETTTSSKYHLVAANNNEGPANMMRANLFAPFLYPSGQHLYNAAAAAAAHHHHQQQQQQQQNIYNAVFMRAAAAAQIASGNNPHQMGINLAAVLQHQQNLIPSSSAATNNPAAAVAAAAAAAASSELPTAFNFSQILPLFLPMHS